jgi:hypothetical protein
MSSRGIVIRFVGLCLFAGLLVGCGGPEVGDEVDDPISSTSSTAPPATTLVPANPDVAYFNDVLAKLNKVRGDVRRDVYATQSLSELSRQRLRDVYTDHQLPVAMKIWSDASLNA